jgi:hypothetical protein
MKNGLGSTRLRLLNLAILVFVLTAAQLAIGLWLSVLGWSLSLGAYLFCWFAAWELVAIGIVTLPTSPLLGVGVPLLRTSDGAVS